MDSASRILLQLEWFKYLGTILTEVNDNNYRNKATNNYDQWNQILVKETAKLNEFEMSF